MKKSALIFGMFSLMLLLTSFTQIGGNRPVGEIGGNRPVGEVTAEIGGNRPVGEIGGNRPVGE